MTDKFIKVREVSGMLLMIPINNILYIKQDFDDGSDGEEADEEEYRRWIIFFKEYTPKRSPYGNIFIDDNSGYIMIHDKEYQKIHNILVCQEQIKRMATTDEPICCNVWW